MGVIINALKGYLGERLKTDSRVVSVDKKGDKYIIYLSDSSNLEAEAVVIATPAYATSEMMKGINKNLSLTLGEIFYPSISVVCFGYKQDKIKQPLDGFGFLIPNREGRKILGTLWDSSIFPNRAPEGYVLLRSMLGGVRKSELALQDEDKLINIVIDELQDIMDIRVQPDFVKVYKHEKGIPQYSLGHEKRLETISEIISRFKGLYLTGNAYRGIGVNDSIDNSYKLAERIVKKI